MRKRVLLLAFLIAPGVARAELNDPACVPAPEHPNPVVLVHGRGGDVNGFPALVGALEAAGYCVYGTNYGQTGGTGPNGHDHLTVSGAQIATYIDEVLAATGAAQVDVIGHSAGTGVLANMILEKNRGDRIRRAISFGGLHHPYAHAGASGFADATLFLPNLIVTARRIDPDITAQEVITGAINLYAGVGGSLAGIDVETATSNFAADLFEPRYWISLHGRLSENDGDYIRLGDSRRGRVTYDSDPDICYTNIVSIGDLLAGAAAGFQDPAPNVDNFLLLSGADHVQMLADPAALAKTLDALGKECNPPPPQPAEEPDDPDAEPGDPVAGCSASDAGATGASIASCLLAALAVLGLAVLDRRRR